MRGESLSTTSAVGFAAQAIPGFRYEDPRSGLAAVLGHLLATGYLWEKVRMEGGAYGVFAYPRNLDGLFLFGSYRDPKIGPSLKAYRESLRAAGRGGLEAEVEQALIGTIGNEDRPLDPGEKGFREPAEEPARADGRDGRARRDALLAVNAASLAEAASQLLAGWDRGACAAIAGKEALAEAARDVPELAGRVAAPRVGSENGVNLEAFILGTGGMMPLPGRSLTSILLRREGELFLFDCGRARRSGCAGSTCAGRRSRASSSRTRTRTTSPGCPAS